MRTGPYGHGACGVTFSGYRRKPFILPVLFWERVRSLPLLAPKATKKRSHAIPPCCSGKWPTAPSVDSIQVRYKYQRPSVVDILLHAESDMRPSSLDLGR
jgi:hypothetical protein